MLIQLPRAQFHRSGVIRKAEKYSKRLEEIPLVTTGQDLFTEIIPYEQLWVLVIETLEDKFYYL